MSATGRDGAARRRVLTATRLYLIVTPPPDDGGRTSSGWMAATRAALATGLVGMVQWRAKGASDAEILDGAARLREIADAAGALLVLNDRPDLVRAARADGVHVGEGDPPPRAARAAIGPEGILGVSTHDEREVEAAVREGSADYLGLGPCFPTETKALAREPGGPALVRRCLPHAGDRPVFPIGGISTGNARAIAAAGATRVAVGSAVLGVADPAEAVRALDRALREGRSRSADVETGV